MFYASSSKLLATVAFETEAEAVAQANAWNEADETAYRDEKGNWQRMSGCEAVATVLTQAEFEELA